MSQGLAAIYEQLKLVDQDLRAAERKLLAAHLNHGNKLAPRPEEIYREVLSLREKSKQLSARLGDRFVSGAQG